MPHAPRTSRRRALNERLQGALTPAREGAPERRFGGRVYRVGDKVMQLRNNYDKGTAGVFDGSVGVVTALSLELDVTPAFAATAAAWLAETEPYVEELARLEVPSAFEQRQADRRSMLAPSTLGCCAAPSSWPMHDGSIADIDQQDAIGLRSGGQTADAPQTRLSRPLSTTYRSPGTGRWTCLSGVVPDFHR